MQTIAVLTDLSAGSCHATKFALHMAKKMKAGIMLFSVHTTTVKAQFALAVGGDESPDEYAPGNNLPDYCRSMELLQRQSAFPGAYIPQITYNPGSSEMEDVMTCIGNGDSFALLITPLLGCEDLATFLAGDTCSRIIDWATVPVLAVPPAAAIRNYEKMAFVATSPEKDQAAMAHLCELMEEFAAELMVACLDEDLGSLPGTGEAQYRDIYKEIDYGRIYFRMINGGQKDWAWLKANKKTDVLAIVQRPRAQMAEFFKRNVQLDIPVIVFPKIH